MFYKEFCSDHGSNYEAHKEDKPFFVDGGMSKNLGVDKVEIY
jgi:hypothetical protein